MTPQLPEGFDTSCALCYYRSLSHTGVLSFVCLQLIKVWSFSSIIIFTGPTSDSHSDTKPGGAGWVDFWM
jgi:hypothetical protein